MRLLRLGWMVSLLSLVGGTALAADTQQLARGRYLVEGVVACGNCHGARNEKGQLVPEKGLSGGMLFDEPPFKAYAANITMDAESGIGKWTAQQLARAIREGVRPDNSIIGPPMPVEFYRHLSDEDLAAIVAYLRAQPAVKNNVAKSVYNIPLPPTYGPRIKGLKTPPTSDKVKYGEYLANIGHCMECHTPHDERGQLEKPSWGAGGMEFKGPWGVSVSRNLTPHAAGLKNWTDEQIIKAVRSGTDRDGKPYRPPMGFEFYSKISDADMAALVAYLRSLRPVVSASK